jgi:hypothetical protein
METSHLASGSQRRPRPRLLPNGHASSLATAPMQPIKMLLVGLLSALLAATVSGAWTPLHAAPGPISVYVLDGEPGFYQNNGVTMAQKPPDAPVLQSEWSDSNRLSFEVLDVHQSPNVISFGASKGEVLQTGTYTGTEPDAYPENGQPRMQNPCGHYEEGSFTVHELSWAGDVLERFAVTFSYRCPWETGGSPGREYRGEIRYQSTVDVKAITVTPQAIDYPDRFTDTSSSPRTVTVRNPGTLPLELTTVSLGGSNPGQFELSADGCSGTTLAPDGQCSFRVTFAPTTGGDKEAKVLIDDATTYFGRHWVALTGTAVAPRPDVQIDWGSMDFPEQPIGTASEPQQKYIHSGGNVPVEIGTVSITGTGKDNFVLVEDSCSSTTLPEGESCWVKIRFKPVEPGWQTAEIRVTSNDSDSPDLFEFSALALRAESAVELKAMKGLGPRTAWNTGSAIARTQSSGGDYLHAALTSPIVGGKWVKDTGPYLGVKVARRETGGTIWSGSFRVNPASQHGDRITLAASGKSVYATWVKLTKVVGFKPSQPRVVLFRSAGRHGDPSQWGAVERLSSKTGRVDFPTIAASGARVYVAWTNADNGFIKLAVSPDRGKSWSEQTLGVAEGAFGEGRAGYPSVAADDNLVAVAWLEQAGTVVARLSTDAGATWSPPEALTGALAAKRARRNDIDAPKASRVDLAGGLWHTAEDPDLASSMPSVAVLAGRAAVTWATGDSVKVRVWENGAWGPLRGAYGRAEQNDNIDYIYGPTVALNGGDALGVAFSVLHKGGGSSTLMWSESSDDGASWYHRKRIGTVRYEDRVNNDWPSVAWPWKGKRVIVWNASGPHTIKLQVREATGSP